MSNETRIRLLNEYKTIIMPEEIDHNVYEQILESTLIYPDDEIQLYCHGGGGYSGDAFAIVDAIRLHGKFTGHMIGSVVSSHGMIWAACNKRYVYPHSRLGLHKVITGSISAPMNAVSLRQKADNHESIDNMNAQIFADASDSDHDFYYWKHAINCADLGMNWKDSVQIVEVYKMALPIDTQLQKDVTVNAADMMVNQANGEKVTVKNLETDGS